MLKDNLGKFSFFLVLTLLFASCDDTVTYSEMKEKERKAVNDYIEEQNIKIILIVFQILN